MIRKYFQEQKKKKVTEILLSFEIFVIEKKNVAHNVKIIWFSVLYPRKKKPAKKMYTPRVPHLGSKVHPDALQHRAL